MKYIQPGVVFCLRKTCHAGSGDCRSGFCWREEWRIHSAGVPPPMWITAAGVNRICLFHHCAHFNQGAPCNKLGNREDHQPNAFCFFCACCSPVCTVQVPAPSSRAQRRWHSSRPQFSSHCLETTAFWDTAVTGSLQGRY